jgi:hypothetical protein
VRLPAPPRPTLPTDLIGEIRKQLALSHRQDVAALPAFLQKAAYQMRVERHV